MKILGLRLTAFGPFTNRTLDLSAGNHGFHVVFGPNEAGKSSALRALHALLYGIPGQTTDKFVHPYESLRLGGSLRLSNNDAIEFVRRKGNKGTLLEPDGSRLDDHALDRFLGGVGAEQFRMFWGIDHAQLVQGGGEILEGKGDLGESLFAAGSGASHLRSLRRQLDEEAAALFVPRGYNRTINQAVAALKDLRSAQRDLTVSAEKWAHQDKAFHEAEAQVEALAARTRSLSAEKSRCERVKRVLPLLAERNELSGRLRDLDSVVLLAEDFPRRRQDADAELRVARERLDRATEGFREQEELVQKLGVTPPLVAEMDAVNDLQPRLGSHRKALRDRPERVGQRNEQRTLAQRLLGELRPDLDVEHAETLRVFLGRRASIQKLAAERERLDERLETARKRYKTAEEQATALRAEASHLSPARNGEPLAEAIEAARSQGDAEAERGRIVRSIERMNGQRGALLEKTGLPKGVVDRLQRLRVPSAAALTRFERGAKDLEDEARAEKAEQQRIMKATRDLDAKIETLRTKKAVPTEDDLTAARQRRDSGFGLLRDHWEKGRDVTVEARELLGEGKLIDLFPGTVRHADGVADRLRSEADRVAELAQYLEERERLARDAEAVETAARRREKSQADHEAAWSEAWKSVLDAPPPIHEARAWCQDFDRLVERSDELAGVGHRLEDLDAWAEVQVKAMLAAMRTLGVSDVPADGLAATTIAAEKQRQRLDAEARVRGDHARRTGETEATLGEAGKVAREAQAELARWQDKWAQAVGGLAQGDPPLPDDALSAVDVIERLLRALDEAAGYHARIEGIDRDAVEFRADVRSLATRLGEALRPDADAEEAWVEQLRGMLAEGLREEVRRKQAHDGREKLRDETERSEKAVKSAEAVLSALRDEAQCGPNEDLVASQRRSDELRARREALAAVERNVLLSGDGASITELDAEAVGTDRDALDARMREITAELDEVEKALTVARDARAAAQAELRGFQGPSAASEKAEEIQAMLARLGEDVLRYGRLRVAATLLARRIDDYRRKNQAPLLLRAGELFRELTLDRYERLEADVEDDIPILVGVGSSNSRVPAHGMSEGTRDQLFLALRLAAVEASCATSEPMPFIVDDVLVQFDDDRGAAALRVLADVASRTQIVLFTHHRHVRAGAEALASADVFVHEL